MTFLTKIPSDLQIAREATLKPLEDITAGMGIGQHLLEPYGDAVAKINLEAIEEPKDQPRAKYVLISAITPTPLGEGKTTTTVGLRQAFKHIGKRATVAIRQPSMGPTFGIKGGAAGGGYSQVVPMETFNLHLTGDNHAVTASRQLDSYEKNGFGRLPVCIAKTHLSISSDPALKGAPTGWTLPVRRARASAGAGFIDPICGDMRTMPGLSASPAAHNIDIDEHGQVVGLS